MTDRLRIAHITDLHLTEGPRLQEQAEILNAIVVDAARLGVQATLVTGDVYGRTVPHRSTPAERAVLYPAIRQLATLGPVVVVPGNHDYPGDLDTLAQLGGGMDWPVIVQTSPKPLKLRTSGPPLHVYAVPWATARNIMGAEATPRAPEQRRQAIGEKLDQLMQLWGARVSRARSKDPSIVHVLASHCMVRGSRTSGGEVLTGHEIELSRASMEAMGVDYGALGHMHYRQQAANRCWYAGNPWPTDFGETDNKGWHLVDVYAEPPSTHPPHVSGAEGEDLHSGDGASYTHVQFIRTAHRRWLTLDYRWAADHEDGSPRWVAEPTAAELARVAGAEIRARLVVPQQWVAGCPWDQVIADLQARGAHRITAQRVTEPVHRVRSPAVAEAVSEADKMVGYWATLAAAPDPNDSASAQSLLADLLSMDDDEIRAETDRMVGGGQ